MSQTAMALGIGTIIGIIIFFVMASLGLIDKLIASIEGWFEQK